MKDKELICIMEAIIMASSKPINVDKLFVLLNSMDIIEKGNLIEIPSKDKLLSLLDKISTSYKNKGIELKLVASGYRFQVKSKYAHWVSKLWEEKPQKYSRALLETLALIAYRQPITRGDIENVRGVSVSSQIIRTLLDREWVRVIGHRDVPGKPAMYATTKQFLDYFSIKKLDELPPLSQLMDIDKIDPELDFGLQVDSAKPQDFAI
ncbi:MAG: SMC-Scp complex subunit ScpB [Pseudomonadota bacterium]